MAHHDDPTHDLVWRELCGLLDHELHSLPEQLRQPLVLCYLAGQTQDEAARQLGVHPRSVQRRLRSALETLHGRLSRFGPAFPLAALGPLLASRTGDEVPEDLLDATTRAATGTLSAASVHAISLASGRPFGRWKLWAAAAAATLVVVAGAFWWASTRILAVPTPTPEPVAAVAEPAPAAEKPPQSITVWGRVVDADRRPVPNATVFLLSRPIRRLSDRRVEPIPDPLATRTTRLGKFRELARAVTDAEGLFKLAATVVRPDPTTKARWFQTLPYAMADVPVQVTDIEAEYSNLVWLPGVNN